MAGGSRRGWRRACVAFLISFGLAGVFQPTLAIASGKRATANDEPARAKKPAAASRTSRAAAPTGSSARRKAARAPVESGAKRVKVFVDTRTKVAAEARAPVADSARAGQARPSIGHAFGLHDVEDPLSLESAVALVLDQRSGEVLFEKNSRAVLPIASISKLMTAIVVLDAKLPLDEMLEISEADVDTERFTRSRLRTGTRLTRDELLHLALMSSENRAAHALGRHYPGGMPAFVAQMNRKAQELGMTSSGFVEPTGLSSSNVSSARDLALLVQAASRYPLIREYSTASALSVDTGRRTESYRNTNRLIDRSDWEIGVQKTGFISEAGNCVVMQARIASRPVVMVLLDAEQRTARVSDSLRIRQWVEGLGTSGVRRVTHPDDEAQQPAREPGAHNV
ncbi:MAG: D-alanyl-D-alanine endopeptidase [Burkholderiaceae bacterium]|nr:D-alanyl-D-alanine endopeptidase [Burkholderiaceae bacterium]